MKSIKLSFLALLLATLAALSCWIKELDKIKLANDIKYEKLIVELCQTSKSDYCDIFDADYQHAFQQRLSHSPSGRGIRSRTAHQRPWN